MQRLLMHRVFATQEGLCDQDIISEAMGHLYDRALPISYFD